MNWTPMLLIVGGGLAVIGLVWLATRGGKAPAAPTPGAPAPLATNEPATGARPADPLGDLAKPAGQPQVQPSAPVEPPVTTIRQGTLATNNPGLSPSLASGATSAMVPAASPSGMQGAPGATPTTPAVPSGASGAGSGAMSGSVPGDLAETISAGRQRMLSGDAVGARAMLSRAMIDARLPESDRAALRDDVSRINEDLVFSQRVDPADPFAYAYSIQPGDSLIKIDQREKLGPDWRFIQRVNKMSSPGSLSVGRKLKLVRGPFHAVVTKSAYRLDLYMGDPAKPGELVFVRSFRVGLGEGGSTPLGEFRVRPGSKLVNPHWINPRTREKYDANDPKNPIGEHWIGLEGLGQYSTITGYGIHGTIEPDSIGQQRSMGCVRLGTEDIALLYEMLGEGGSTVKIAP